jgi:hypothetical protein
VAKKKNIIINLNEIFNIKKKKKIKINNNSKIVLINKNLKLKKSINIRIFSSNSNRFNKEIIKIKRRKRIKFIFIEQLKGKKEFIFLKGIFFF